MCETMGKIDSTNFDVEALLDPFVIKTLKLKLL